MSKKNRPRRKRNPLPELHNVKRGRDGRYVEASFITHQDSILPVRLNFPPPLAHLGTDPSTFDYQWQHLTYAFGLPDPADFPPLPNDLPAEDVRNLKRFIAVCEKVASYTVVAHKGGITMSGESGKWRMEVDATEDEETVGFSVRFRQLHSSSAGDPDFAVVSNVLNKYARQFTDEQTDKRLAILEQWRKARGKLMNRPLQNIVCRMVLERDNCPDIEQHEMYGDVKPTDLINLFNYGELIHFGKHSADYDEMAEEPDQEAIQHNNFMISMLGLVHLYFCFAEVIRSAIGLRNAPASS